MPRYEYACEQCGRVEDQRRPVEDRDLKGICECWGEMYRQFTPTAMIAVPDHFRYLASWCLPPKEDTAAWDARANPSQTHAPKEKTLKEHLAEEFLTREKITLSSG